METIMRYLQIATVACLLFYSAILSTGIFVHTDAQYYKHARYVQSVNTKVSFNTAVNIARSIVTWSTYYNIKPSLMFAIAKIESRFRPKAKSPSNAKGIFQVIVRWHPEKVAHAKFILGKSNPYDVEVSTYLGVRVLAEYMSKLPKGHISKALSKYGGYGNASSSVYSRKVLAELRKVNRALS